MFKLLHWVWNWSVQFNKMIELKHHDNDSQIFVYSKKKLDFIPLSRFYCLELQSAKHLLKLTDWPNSSQLSKIELMGKTSWNNAYISNDFRVWCKTVHIAIDKELVFVHQMSIFVSILRWVPSMSTGFKFNWSLNELKVVCCIMRIMINHRAGSRDL